MANIDWLRLHDSVMNTFTPTAPIHRRELFIGRAGQITKMLDAIRQPGAHAIIYGERGVGKTSLVSILQQLLDDQLLANVIISKATCDGKDTYYTLWKKIFMNLTVTENQVVVKTTTQGMLDIPKTLDLWLDEDASSDDVRRLVLTLKGRQLIVIIDEFDSVSANLELTNQIANTIKMFSDTVSPSTFILVGIADTVAGLIAQHSSIDRCLIEILMPRMSVEELRALIVNGMQSNDMSIDGNAVNYICQITQGLPSYGHLLARESAYVAIDSHRKNVTKEDAINGLKNSVDLVPAALVTNWEEATASPKPNSMLKQVLLACALAPKNELGFFTPADIRDPIREVTGKDYEIPGYGYSLHLLTEDKRACILEKRGASHRWRYRFRNPLMESYAIMYGLKNGLIAEATINHFRLDIPKTTK